MNDTSTTVTIWKQLNKPMTIKQIEWIVLLIVGIAYWYPSPIRDQWVWLILLWAGVILIRFITQKRFWTNTLFDESFTIFLGLCLISIFSAPYETRGIILLFRPLFGFALVLSLGEHARIYKNITPFYYCTTTFGLTIGFLSLVTVNWSGKGSHLEWISNLIPRIDVFFLEGGMNPNEVAGVIALLLPFCLFYALKMQSKLAWAATILLSLSLFLGQSLSGISGVILGCIIIIIPSKFWKYLTIVIVLFLISMQLSILLAPRETAYILADLSGRTDDTSMLHRAELWESAVNILHDHPISGVGIAMYRNPVVREAYPTEGFSSAQAVHPHNMVLQFTSDLGYPGLLVIVMWYGIAGYMIWMIDRLTIDKAKSVAPALAAALIAHATYGLTDAVPVWDRFGFVFFWFLGLVAAQYYLVRLPSNLEASVK